MRNRIIKNYTYNFIYQIAAFIIPLITAPYLARILGVDGVGQYTFYYSKVYFFSMFVLLGTSNYGNRSIARCLGDKKKIETVFNEIFTLQFICGVIVTLSFFIYLYFVCPEPRFCICFLPFILSSMFDVNWFFFGQENFKIVVFRNMAIKVVTTCLIFIFVRSKDDLVIYVLIMSLGYLLSQLIVWQLIIRMYTYHFPGIKRVFVHLKPNLILFIPFISVSIYRYMDKIMVGEITTISEVGYYENAEKIVSILMSFITAIGTVMLPRMSALYAENNQVEIKNMLNKTTAFMSFMASVVAFGIASISERLVLWYYGDEFIGSILILKLLCITIPFICYANIIRMQILIPKGLDRAYVLSTIFGAAINLLFNLFMIPRLGGIGAAIGTVIAEFSVMIYQLVAIRKMEKSIECKRLIVFFWLNGFIMYMVVSAIGLKFPNGFLYMLIQVIVGFAVYLLGIVVYSIVFKDKTLVDYFNALLGKKKTIRREAE